MAARADMEGPANSKMLDLKVLACQCRPTLDCQWTVATLGSSLPTQADPWDDSHRGAYCLISQELSFR